ncbi:unnamed protein product [Mucor hiemalis]
MKLIGLRSHYFLAQGGVNTQVLIKELGTIHLGGFEEHRQPIQDMDMEGYIQQQRTETIMEVIEDGRQEIIQDTNDGFIKSTDEYWEGLLNNKLKVKEVDTSSSMNLTKAKIDQSRILSVATTTTA